MTLNGTALAATGLASPRAPCVAYLSDSFAKRELFGLSRYAHELRDALVAQDVVVKPVSAYSEWADERPPRLEETGFRRLPLKRRHLALMWCYLSEPRLEHWTGPVDLVHSVDTDYPAATHLPWVLTVHDLGVLSQPAYFSKARRWMLRRMLAEASRRAEAVICISRATADEVVRFAPKGIAAKIRVIASGVGEPFFAPADPAELASVSDLPPPSAPFFLFTGSMNPRKNLVRTVRAFAAIADQIPHHLVLVGSAGWDSDPLLAEIMRSGVAARIHRPGYVTDAQLRALYAAADAYLYASLYEGFGLPILEAMAAGCPVLTSNISSMPEVAGDAALLTDPTDDRAMAADLFRLGRDAGLRRALAAAGLERARGFTWARCGEQTRAVYESVL